MEEFEASLTSEALLASLHADEPDPRALMAEARSTRGAVIEVQEVGPLEPDDFIILATATGYRKAQPIQHLRASHHELARLLAQGHTREECALFTHYSESRINVLCLDPTFQALVEQYQRQAQNATADIPGILLNVALDAVQTFRERLEENPDDVSNKDLGTFAKLGLDRAGYGPTSKSLNMNLSAEVTPDKLAELHARAATNSRASVRIVDSRSQAALPAPSESPSDGHDLDPDLAEPRDEGAPDGRGVLADDGSEALPPFPEPEPTGGSELPD